VASGQQARRDAGPFFLYSRFAKWTDRAGKILGTMEESLSSLMDEIRGRVELLESSLPKFVDAMAVSQTAKLPFKALLYREALIWRMAELVRGAFDSFTEDKLVSAILLTRAAVETSAALWYLCAKIANAVESNAVGDIDDYLMKLLIGIATGPPATAASPTDAIIPRPVRVGDFLDQVEKDIKGFRHQYGILSDYAHPNWAGTALLYSKNDTENRVTEFGQNIRKANNTKRIGAGNLAVALQMFERSYNRIADLLPAFTALCETQITNSGQQK
jgi:hypothetical protein